MTALSLRVVVATVATCVLAINLVAAPAPKHSPKPILTCDLKVESVRRAAAKDVLLTTTVTNRTTQPIDIVWTLNPMEYLDLVVTDQNGKRVETTPYGFRFSPVAFDQHFLLHPNVPHSHPIYLWTVFPDYKLPPGTYRVRAVFRYHLLRCHSEEVTVTVK